jgi:hypothetical protein
VVYGRDADRALESKRERKEELFGAGRLLLSDTQSLGKTAEFKEERLLSVCRITPQFVVQLVVGDQLRRTVKMARRRCAPPP